MRGNGPMLKDGRIVEGRVYQTSGEYVLVATGLGKTIDLARRKVYRTIEGIHFPDMMYRTDIGEKVQKVLGKLQDFGWLLDMEV